MYVTCALFSSLPQNSLLVSMMRWQSGSSHIAFAIGVLVPACRAYTEKTGRIVTFEYTLVAGFNDRPEDARALLALLKPVPSRVNLIPLNPVKEFSGRTPSAAACEAFRAALERGGLNATLRRSKGRGVNASCGQLRRARIGAR